MPRLIWPLATFCLLSGVSSFAADPDPDSTARVGVPFDWSHRHTQFSQPKTFEQLRALQSDARYWHNLYRRIQRLEAAADREEAADADPDEDSATGKIDWGESVGLTALSYTAADNYPAKYSFNSVNPTPDCTNDYVVFALPTGTGTKANLVAFNNLYVSNAGNGKCAGTLPKALFTYNASQGAGGLNSSPALSLDGKQIAFIENSAAARFHVLKWKAGNVAATFGSPFNAAAMANCQTNGAAAPCEYTVTYSGTTASLSAPYIDYGTDTAYVTDDAGKVISVSPVFGGGQPVVRTTVSVTGGNKLTAPVYDSVSKNLFVIDSTGTLYYIRTAAGSAGVCASGVAPCLGKPSLLIAKTGSAVETPVVDSANGKVFAFSNSSPTGANSSVVQTNTTLATSVVATVGPVGSQKVLAGSFDNKYFNSTATGMLYVCGTSAANIPQLYGIKFAAGGVMAGGAAAKGPFALATATTSCSALTEVFNTSLNKDELYLSVANKCSAGVKGGCIKRFDITAGFPAAVSNTVAESGGTTGLIIDNVSNGGNQSQTNIYFVTLGAQSCSKYTSGTNATANCAVKLTQNALQ